MVCIICQGVSVFVSSLFTFTNNLSCSKHKTIHTFLLIQAAGRFGRMSVRAAIVVGNAVKTKIQQQKNVIGTEGGGDDSVPEADQLNELLQSQIATDETDLDINGVVNATALDEDPTKCS